MTALRAALGSHYAALTVVLSWPAPPPARAWGSGWGSSPPSRLPPPPSPGRSRRHGAGAGAEGGPWAPASSPGPRRAPEVPPPMRAPGVARVLVLAHHWRGLIRERVGRDQADLARLVGVSRVRVTQVMDLLWLALNLQDAVLDGRVLSPPRANTASMHAPRVGRKRVAYALVWLASILLAVYRDDLVRAVLNPAWRWITTMDFLTLMLGVAVGALASWLLVSWHMEGRARRDAVCARVTSSIRWVRNPALGRDAPLMDVRFHLDNAASAGLSPRVRSIRATLAVITRLQSREVFALSEADLLLQQSGDHYYSDMHYWLHPGHLRQTACDALRGHAVLLDVREVLVATQGQDVTKTCGRLEVVADWPALLERLNKEDAAAATP